MAWRMNVAVEWLALLLCIREVLYSYLSLDSGYSDRAFLLFDSVPSG